MPPLGMLIGGVDFKNLKIILKAATEDVPPVPAVSINYGVFINTIINFLIIAAVVFFFVVRPVAHMNARQKAAQPVPAPAAPTTKECSYCYTQIPIKATRCPNCTSELKK